MALSSVSLFSRLGAGSLAMISRSLRLDCGWSVLKTFARGLWSVVGRWRDAFWRNLEACGQCILRYLRLYSHNMNSGFEIV